MPAQGFERVAGEDLAAEHRGRLWRVKLRNGDAVSLGNKGIESITLGEDIVIVRQRHGGAGYPLDEVESVLVETEPPKQRTLSSWGGS
ncbi:hypothetical protein G3I44_14080 [Halogeometricum borinquense]|uniref:Uncharacterized protein n=1 Tax=Halogeometricum borinquense TaxID=60847 RepID=A0A6C0UIP8_9EURY|nr:hypothetical protein [Halogeometricum borinquense]QIB75315.1 hypothetical protein G3I44_14080 [Halogeometricum borinquense]